VGGSEENEVVLLTTLTCFTDVLSQLLKNKVDNKTLLTNFEPRWARGVR